ncbi:MAG: DUF4159 domain-containing protein [Gemmatimonadaceae bacterium]
MTARFVIPSAARDLHLNCRFLATLGMTALVLLGADTAEAQRRGGRRGFGDGDPNSFYVPPDFRGNVPYDGRFTFARIKYRGYERFMQEGPGWSHDYPRAEEHLMRIMREITSIRPFVESEKAIGGNILALDDPELMKYPIAYLSEPGGWHPNEKEASGLRNYLLKGGFVIVDDFDNSGGDLQHFQNVMQQVLPKATVVDIPESHPIFDSFFKVDLRMMERGEANYGSARYLGIYQDNDPKKRLMMIVNLNLDVGEHWQWSNRGFSPVPSNEAYKLGVNYLIYALTH